MSVCLSSLVYQAICLFVYSSVSLSLSLTVSLSLPIFLSLYQSFFLSLYIFLSVSFSLSVFLSACLSLTSCLCLSTCLSPCVFLHVCLCLFVCSLYLLSFCLSVAKPPADRETRLLHSPQPKQQFVWRTYNTIDNIPPSDVLGNFIACVGCSVQGGVWRGVWGRHGMQ